MASFTAKLGAFDFAQYVRVGPGEGLDPYGSGWEEPMFLDNAATEGRPLVGLDVKNREQVWPLYLNAPDKDALHTLIRDLNREIRFGAQPQRIEWKDKGATNSTFYDVAQARLDPSFSFRQSEHGWFAGNLHVWSQPPYGHTATERLIGTIGGTNAFAAMAMPSLAGDAGAQLHLTMSAAARPIGASGGEPGGVLTVMSVCPGGWNPVDIGASLGGDQNATVIGASGAIGSQALRSPVPTTGNSFIAGVFTRTPSGHVGRGRVILHMKADLQPPWNFSLQDFNGGPAFASVSIPSAKLGRWSLVDLGVVESDPDPGFSGLYMVQMGATAAATSRFAYLDAVMFLPEDSTTLVWERLNASQHPNGGTIVSTYIIDGTRDKTIRRSNAAYLGRRPAVVDSKRIGAIPQVAPQASQSLLVAQLGIGLDPNSAALSTDVRVRERFTFGR